MWESTAGVIKGILGVQITAHIPEFVALRAVMRLWEVQGACSSI